MNLTNACYYNKTIKELIDIFEEFHYLQEFIEDSKNSKFDFWLEKYPQDFIDVVSLHANGDDTNYTDVVMLVKLEIGKGVCEHYMYMPCDGICSKCNHAETKYKWYVLPEDFNQIIEDVCKGVCRAWRESCSQSEMPF